jgi:hypothetical protein
MQYHLLQQKINNKTIKITDDRNEPPAWKMEGDITI